MKKLLKRYRAFIVSLAGMIVFILLSPQIGWRALGNSVDQIKQMMLVIPPIFVLMGLLDVWVPKETMIKYMGEGSGIKGILLAVFIGSAAAGPLYGAFPVAAVFMKKGVKFSNILIFIGAWSTTKIPMLLFEIAALGTKFALTRLLVDIPGILIIAWILSKLLSKQEVRQIYENAETID